MSVRIAGAEFLVRAGRFIRSLSVMVMRPSDLIEFNRRAYSKPQSVEGWAEDKLVDAGLWPEEKALLDRIPVRGGRVLLLGVGGGREAAQLAAMGFEVTGVDFIPALAVRASENLRRRGFVMPVLVQDISRLEVPASHYAAVWLTSGTYSSLPTRRRRIEMLRRIHRALEPGGHFLCQFIFDQEPEFKGGWELARKTVSWITLGNLSYERGDRLAGNSEFVHTFATDDDVRSEFLAGGFEVIELTLPREGPRGGAVLRKIT